MSPAKRHQRTPVPSLLLASVALTAVAVAGCAASPKPPGLAGQPGNTAQVAAIWHTWAQCARSHGLPALPDPRLRVGGGPDFGSYHFHFDSLPATVQTACGPILGQLPGESATGTPLSNADFRKLLHFAACMRQHGIPSWPDPSPQGVFTLNPQIRAGGKGLIQGPLQACERYNTDPHGGINAVEGG